MNYKIYRKKVIPYIISKECGTIQRVFIIMI